MQETILFFTKVAEWMDEFDDIQATYYVADFEDILDLQLEGIDYPIAVVELPDFIPDSENTWTTESAIAILSPIAPDDYEQAELVQKMQELGILTKNLTDYMLDCAEDGVRDISTVNPITKATASNLYGWRFLFKMDF